MTDRAQKKLEFIKGHSISRNFPDVQPTTEWVGAVLDFIEEIENKNDNFDSKVALKLAGKMSMASMEVTTCSNPMELSSRIQKLKEATTEYDNYIFNH